MALITLQNVTIAFEGIAAVENVDFTIENGDYAVIIGENGSGKSTLIRAMLGLVHARNGKIVYGDGLKQNQIGYLPQQTHAQQDFPASVEEVVLSGCVNQIGAGKFFYSKKLIAKAEEKMRILNIENIRDKSYRTLSGGQRQRVLLARALCATDSLLLLDEPVTGLDPASSAEMYAMLRTLNRDHGVTVVMVSHDLHGAMQDATKVIVVDKGVDFCGTVAEYKNDYQAKAGEF